jgi:hypothetical protein
MALRLRQGPWQNRATYIHMTVILEIIRRRFTAGGNLWIAWAINIRPLAMLLSQRPFSTTGVFPVVNTPRGICWKF